MGGQIEKGRKGEGGSWRRAEFLAQTMLVPLTEMGNVGKAGLWEKRNLFISSGLDIV